VVSQHALKSRKKNKKEDDTKTFALLSTTARLNTITGHTPMNRPDAAHEEVACAGKIGNKRTTSLPHSWDVFLCL
jgi:hypothetical protein